VRARAEVARNNQTVADATRTIAIARRNLQTLTGLDPGDAADLPADNLEAPVSLSELEARVPEVPSVRAAEKDYLAAQRVANSARLAIVPTVGAQFTEQVTNFGGFTGQNTVFNTGLYFAWRLDVPTFANMGSQSANEATAGLQLEKTKLQARDQINTDWQTLQAALIKVDATKSQVEASQRAQQVATVRYQAGAATQLDVITADRDLFIAEVQQIQARTDLASARLSLRISAAQPLDVQ
jgi:outer membrane protein TolC